MNDTVSANRVPTFLAAFGFVWSIVVPLAVQPLVSFASAAILARGANHERDVVRMVAGNLDVFRGVLYALSALALLIAAVSRRLSEANVVASGLVLLVSSVTLLIVSLLGLTLAIA